MAISHIVQKMIDENVIYREALLMDIVNCRSLGKRLKPDVEKIFREEVKLDRVTRNIERYAKKLLKKQQQFEFNFFKSINLNNDVCYIVVHESPKTREKIQRLYQGLDLSDGGVFNILQGNHEIAIITNKEFEETVLDNLKDENITHVADDHDSISLIYSKDYSFTPGVIYNIMRQIAWENINVLTWLHTPFELTLIVHENDSMKCFNILRKMLKEHKEDNNNFKQPLKQVV